METRRFDGVELLRKLRDKEIDTNTKIQSISACGNEYNISIDAGANKFIFDDGRKVSTGYLSNPDNEFEIIEEDKKIEKIDNAYYHKTQPEQNQIFQRKINELIDKVNSLEKNQ